MKSDEITILKQILDELQTGAKTTMELYAAIDVRRPEVKKIIDHVKDAIIIEEESGMKGGKIYRLPNMTDKINQAKNKDLNRELKDVLTSGVVSIKRFDNYMQLLRDYQKYDSMGNLQQNQINEKLIILYLQCVIESKLISAFLENQMERPLLTTFGSTAKTINSLIVGNLDRFVKSRPNKTNLVRSIADYYKNYPASEIEKQYVELFGNELKMKD